MKIVVIGNGKLGYSLARALAEDGHSVAVVDKNEQALSATLNQIDVAGLVGSGVDYEVLQASGVPEAKVVAAVTQSDEVNIICAIMAKKMGAAHTIARIREPELAKSMVLLRPEMGSGMNVNPELETAEEISRIFRFPSALKVDFFSRGRIEIIEQVIAENSPLAGLRLSDFGARFKARVLVCSVCRGEQVCIPGGDFVLSAGDRISLTGSMRDMNQLFKKIGLSNRKIRSVMIVGGGRVGYYLARILLLAGMDVKILEKDRDRCEALSHLLPKADVVLCDGTAQEALLDEGIAEVDGLAALTGLDEENVIISMFAQSQSVAKVVTKINHITFGGILERAGIDCVVTPHRITTHNVRRYVRALQNSEDSSFETLVSLADGRAEALEFHVGQGFAGNGLPLRTLKLKKNVLVAVILRGGKPVYPTGDDCILPDDTVIFVTTLKNIHEISDVLQ